MPSEWLESALAARIIGVDIETSGLSLERDVIATVQIFIPQKGTIMVRRLQNPTNIIHLIETANTTKIFHHAPFDLGFLVRDYGMWPQRIADTKVAAKILDPKRTRFIHPDTQKGSHSLLSLVWHYFEFKMDKTLAVSDWFQEVLSEEQIAYAAKDVEYLPALLQRLEQELAAQGNLALARSAMAALPTDVMLRIKNFNNIYGYD